MLLFDAPLFADRREAGRLLGARLASGEPFPRPVVYGLARGGVVVAAAVARALDAPLDAIAVRKVRHPFEPEYAIGAVAPGAPPYLRATDGLTEAEVAEAAELAAAEAAVLDERLHAEHEPVDAAGAAAIVVDDGLATGATLIASCRWARARGAATVVAAVPVVASLSLPVVEPETDRLVALQQRDPFAAVSIWYAEFEPVDDRDVLRLLAASRTEELPAAR